MEKSVKQSFESFFKKLFKSFKEVALPILSMAAIVFLLMALFVRPGLEGYLNLLAGTVIVIFGMTLFLFGSDLSMMEVGREAGKFLVKKGASMKNGKTAQVMFVVVFSFVIGVVVTVAEPDVRVLAENVLDVSEGRIDKGILMGVVGVGVGIFMVIATLRILFAWKFWNVLIIGYVAVFAVAVAVTVFAGSKFVPVAFDSGGVTTGPLTVPFFLAYAGGIQSIAAKQKEGDASFGIVGIASIGPILAVMLLGGVYQ